MASSFSSIRSAAVDGRLHNPFYRKNQLKLVHDKLSENSLQIQQAILEDTGYRSSEIKLEFWLALQCLADNFAAIDPENVLRDEYSIARDEDVPDGQEPVGIVVIEPASHAFLYCLVSALGPALATGNCVIVQIGRSMLKTPPLVLQLIQDSLDGDIFQVTHNELKDTEINHRYVRVMQNGSPEPGLSNQIISQSQSRVVAIIERDADIRLAADTLVTAGFSLRGKSPYRADIVLINEWVKKEFLAAVMQSLVRLMADPGDSRISKKLSNSSFLESVAKEGFTDVVSPNSGQLVLNVEDRRSFLMQGKLEEPCLVVHGVTSMDAAIDLSRSYGRLAATYVFASSAAAKYISQFTNSSLCFINHIPSHLIFSPAAPANLPLKLPHYALYQEKSFTLPKQQFIKPPMPEYCLGNILLESALPQLLGSENGSRLPPVKRLTHTRGIGFFEQGIITGGVLFSSIVISCSGLLGWYAFKVARYVAQ